jgi:DNA (cytosine-5)-methyltransferase 1
LFIEQIRIIKEMRENDRANRGANVDIRHIRPRFMVWENVPGAFSSNKGEDFRIVLEETAKIVCEDAVIPRPTNGKWTHAGCIVGDGWSIAWRLHDAQFWGVHQRRKRIALVADFAGGTAPEILFERESLSRDITKSREEREGITTDAEGCFGETIGVDSYNLTTTGTVSKTLQAERSDNEHIPCAVTFQERAGKEGGGKGILIQKERTGALSTLNNQPVCYGISSYNSNAIKSSNPHSGIYEAETTRTLDNNGGNPACNQGGMAVVQSAGFDGYNQSIDEEVAQPLRAADGGDSTPKVCYRKKGHPQNAEQGQGWEKTEINDILNIFDNSEGRTPTVVVDMGGGKSQCGVTEDVTPTLATTHGGEPVVYDASRRHNYESFRDICETVQAHYGTGGGNVPMVVENNTIYSMGHDMRSAKFTDDEITDPLTATDYKDPIKILDNKKTYQHVTGTLDCCIAKGTSNQLANSNMFVANTSVVRRLTPMECERLQNYPDGWTDIGEWVDTKGKKHKAADSPRYKALGNSIALPFWQWMAERMVRLIKNDEPEKEPTMASLFSGIGGFELVFARAGCKPVFSSEIEEFPIAVTKKHFGEE